MRLISTLLCVAAMTTFGERAAGEPPADSIRQVSFTQRFSTRLQELKPSDPRGYLLLAEDVLDAADSQAESRLAVELFARAFEAARSMPGERDVASSACLGLASAGRTARERRWFEVLAAFIDPGSEAPGWLRKPAPTSVDATPYRLAVVLGYVRAGEGTLAKQQLSRPDIQQSFAAIESLLRRGGVPGGVASLTREAENWPCRECGNKAFTRKPGVNPPEYRECPVCRGKPGPSLSEETLVAQIRLESWLLQGAQRSWAAQVTSDDGAPLTDPDPAALCARVGVDGSRMYWRNGRFVRNADGTDEAPKPKEAPAAKDGKAPKPTVKPESPAAGS